MVSIRPDRRLALGLLAAAFAVPGPVHAAGFAEWVAAFRAKALAKGVSAATYDRVMGATTPDTAVYALSRQQAEFNEALWQYINRRVSEWRINTGRERARELAPLLSRLERDYGVDRFMLLALWGVESSFGDVIDNPKYMRPVIPALAALAFGEPRRRPYWEQELINALRIVDRGWSTPKEMVGSWAGAMGHTQWMPEAWLNIGVDYDRDGRINPFGAPDDALAGTCRFLLERGSWRRGESWGCEVALPSAFNTAQADRTTQRSYGQWQSLGISRADRRAFAHPEHRVRLWIPVAGGPAFLFGQNLLALKAYNPAMSYALAITHLSDRIRGENAFVQPFPGSERALTLAEVQEVQKRLTAAGFDTDGTDGRVGRDTMRAVRDFQRRTGIAPADGYAGLKVLARLRQGA